MSLNDEQKKSLQDYTSDSGPGSYSSVNEYGRTGKGSEATKKAYETITHAIDKPLGGNVELFRGTSEDMFEDKSIRTMIKQVKAGNYQNIDTLTQKLSTFVYQDKAPVSTTHYTGATQKADQGYGQNNVGLYILADKNTRGMNIDPVSKYGGKSIEMKGLAGAGSGGQEGETLLHPSNKFKVGAIAFQYAGQSGSVGSKKTRLRTDLYMIPVDHKYVSVKKGANGLRTYKYKRPDGSTYTIEVA